MDTGAAEALNSLFSLHQENQYKFHTGWKVRENILQLLMEPEAVGWIGWGGGAVAPRSRPHQTLMISRMQNIIIFEVAFDKN